MKATNKNKATVTLGLVSLGFAASHPFSQSFVGGMVASGCGAAMIGGLADWFAVSALFRRPLGIPFRTEIIPRNRERISQAIIAMVEDELLTRENIRDTLNHYDVAALIIRYLAEYGGKTHVKEVMRRIADDVLGQVNAEKIGIFLAELLTANAGQIRLAPPLAQALDWTIKQGYVDKLVDFVIAETDLLLQQPQLQKLLADLIREAIEVYEKDMQRRQFAVRILERLGVTSASLAGLVQKKARQFLSDMRQEDHELRLQLRRKAADFAARLASDSELQERFETEKNRFIASYPELAERAGSFVRTVLAAANAASGKAFVHKWIGTQVDALVSGFRNNPRQQRRLSDLARQALLALIDTHHSQIGTIVRERLSQLSTPALVEFLEARVGNDLQMIRINGSVVGGMAGMLIYLLTYWWRLW